MFLRGKVFLITYFLDKIKEPFLNYQLKKYNV